jgi:ribosomal protein S18 acetylase RimI-like enzyme
MLEYAEQELAATLLGKKSLQIYVNELDEDFLELVKARGYFVDDYEDRRLYGLRLPGPVSALQLPQGFRLTSLAEEYNWEKKLHRVLWRGFDYPGEPTYDEDEVEDDRLMFDTPTVRWDLKIAVAAPDGEFVSICGMWFEPVNRFAYIDPVATDPDYRHLHLEKAAVLEGLRRCTALGATMAYVESDEKFYRTLGFREVTHYECWKKYLDEAEKPAPLETSQTPEAETSQPKLDQQQIQRLSLIKLHWGTAHNTPPDKDLNYPN